MPKVRTSSLYERACESSTSPSPCCVIMLDRQIQPCVPQELHQQIWNIYGPCRRLLMPRKQAWNKNIMYEYRFHSLDNPNPSHSYHGSWTHLCSFRSIWSSVIFDANALCSFRFVCRPAVISAWLLIGILVRLERGTWTQDLGGHCKLAVFLYHRLIKDSKTV